MSPGPAYQDLLKRFGISENISPVCEIPEGVLARVLRLRACDVPGADLFSGEHGQRRRPTSILPQGEGGTQ